MPRASSDGISLPMLAGGSKRERILEQLRMQMERMPATDMAYFQDSRDSEDVEVVAELNLLILAEGSVKADSAKVYVNWWPQPCEEDRFRIHYVESSGFNCGWHRQENDHVKGLDHYQEQPSKDSDYTYEPIEFEHDNAVGVIWEVVTSRLIDRIAQKGPDRKLSEFDN